jgi:superfamily II DNA or RNA helicase
LVLDESHWAQDASMGAALRDTYLGRAKLIGLTATPRMTDDERDRLIFLRDYADLCPQAGTGECYLAKPRVESVVTGTLWDPLLFRG